MRRNRHRQGVELVATKVDDLVNRIRELSGDCEIQRFEIIGLRDDLKTRDERIEELEAELATLTGGGKKAKG